MLIGDLHVVVPKRVPYMDLYMYLDILVYLDRGGGLAAPWTSLGFRVISVWKPILPRFLRSSFCRPQRPLSFRWRHHVEMSVNACVPYIHEL